MNERGKENGRAAERVGKIDRWEMESSPYTFHNVKKVHFSTDISNLPSSFTSNKTNTM